MANELSNGSNFDYSRVDDPDLRQEMMTAAVTIAKAKKLAVEQIIVIGQQLNIIRDSIGKQGSGIFLDWIQTEPQITYSQASAYRFMGVAERFENFRSSQLGRIELSAAYELAKTDSPKAAVKAAVKMADAGKEVTVKIAKDLIKKYKPDPEPEEAPKDERYEESEPVDDMENRTEPGGGDSSDLENCTHSWVSDGDGVRYCERCKMDHPDDQAPAPYDAAKHLNGIAATLVQCRLKVDEVVRNSEKHRLTDQIQADLDKALISLRKWASYCLLHQFEQAKK
jgi:hypothetical protein